MHEKWDEWRDVSPSDIEAVTRLLERGEISVTSGGVLERFERRFAQFSGARYAVATNNGTSALHVALWAVGVGHGDEVAVCDYGFHGMAAAVRSLGASVVPVDAEPEGLTMDPSDLPDVLSPKTQAILVHNPWGAVADYAALKRAANGIPLIADASHAHGACFSGDSLAAWVDVACYSLGRGKPISGGELGCAVTERADLRDRMLAYCHVNRVPGALAVLDWKGNAVGLKFRPHPVAMVLALGQLKRYEEKMAGLHGWGAWLANLMEAFGLRPLRSPQSVQQVYWRVVGQAPPPEQRSWSIEDAERALRQAGVPVEANHYWPSLQCQSLFDWDSHRLGIRRRSCPNVERIAPQLMTFPALASPSDSARRRMRVAFETVFGNSSL